MINESTTLYIHVIYLIVYLFGYYLFTNEKAIKCSLYIKGLFLHRFVVSCFMVVKVGSSSKRLFTLVTGVTKHVWEVLGLHMVPCAVAALVRKVTTDGAVVFGVNKVFLDKLKQFTGLFECIA